MKINRLVIENFKSIERIVLTEPNPFTVFVGPNGSGKSNIFEALEFVNIQRYAPDVAISLFGGVDSLRRHQDLYANFSFEANLDGDLVKQRAIFSSLGDNSVTRFDWDEVHDDPSSFQQFHFGFSRIFIGQEHLKRFNFSDDKRLSVSADNIAKVLKRVLSSKSLRDEIFEWINLFVPGLEYVAVAENPFDGKDSILFFEKFSDRPFTRNLISDGTYNILALLTAIYQSNDKPQFLCIEEPENGLHPQVIAEFVNLCRYACEEFGHFVWLNTHSESLVRKLKNEEIILVDKRNGTTQVKQVRDMNLYDLPMDEAWLTGALGGGLPW
jgi:predicted ATPase